MNRGLFLRDNTMNACDRETVTDTLSQANGIIRKKLLFFTVLMFCFGYALVPMYEKFCEVVGINNQRIPVVAENAAEADMSRIIAIELDTNVRGMQWKFKPLQTKVKTHPGELVEVMYEIKNESNHEITGKAIPSYSPRNLDQYLKKIECFCFTVQTLKPDEVKQMPVKFFVDPRLPAGIDTVTISYTFFAQEAS